MRHLVLVPLLLIGCAHHEKEYVTPSPAPAAAAAPAPGSAAPLECRNARIRFEPGSAALGPAARTRLDRVALCLSANQAQRVILEDNPAGRPSPDGGPALSDSRANAVADYLKARGVQPERLRLAVFAVEHLVGPSAAAQWEPMSCADDAGCDQQHLCLNSRCIRITANLPECASARVRFERGSFQIRPEDQPVVYRVARCLKARQAVHLVIEAVPGEGGAPGQDLALGDKRAANLSTYLESEGVSPEQLATTGFVSEIALCSGRDQRCYVIRGVGPAGRRTAGARHPKRM